MKNKGLIATIIIMAGVIVMLLVTLLLIKMPSIVGIKNIIIDAYETEVPIKSETIETIEVIDETIALEPKIVANVVTYTGYNGNVNIEYPELSGMDDLVLQNNINNKIKTNALSIVPLYPISTALQKLNINCEVKYLDDDYITILYSGKVVGKNVSSQGTSGSVSTDRSSASSKNVKNNDPYLDGFVDPLSGNSAMNALPIQNQISGQQSAINGSGLPDALNQVYNLLPTPSANATEVVKDNSTSVNNVKNAGGSTADKGPVVSEIKSPTKQNNSKTSQVYGNIASNNPTSDPLNTTNNSSAGVIYQGNAPSVPSASLPANSSNVIGGAPVYGYAGSNMSAGTIDQNIFYTNTIDLKNCIDVSLDTYADVEKLAKYARSSKVEFTNISDSMASEVKTYIRKTILSTLTEQLKEADFRNVGLETWPKHFSYRDPDGTIYFTIKLSSKLGNYAIIKYTE